MPKIPKRLPFSREYAAPRDFMFRIPEKEQYIFERTPPSGYMTGGLNDDFTYGRDRRPVELIQGPRLPDRVEKARQRYLGALEEYRAGMERMKEEAIYNRTLPERAARLKQEKWDKFLADENHPAYFEDDMDRLFDDEVYDELDERNRFW